MKDELVQILDGESKLSVVVVDCSTAASQIARGHLSGPVASRYLSQALSGVAILGSELSTDDETVSLKLTCSGPLGGFLVESTAAHTLRGYTNKKLFGDYDGIEYPQDATILGDNGTFEVIRSRPGKIIASGIAAVNFKGKTRAGVADGLESCFSQSFQRRARICFSASEDQGGVPIFARGILVECMPDGNFEKFGEVGRLFDEGVVSKAMSLETFSVRNLLKKIGLPNAEIRSRDKVAFACRCSAERVTSMLAALPEEERKTLPPSIDITCHLCGKIWTVKTNENV
ncbi:MAG: Hsp33 family molecular chaperone HslO [Kiritimatiellae bacterium]|nr:Hsp33 family molecular chaperone HslO [Kiritimatiellia bacterium]